MRDAPNVQMHGDIMKIALKFLCEFIGLIFAGLGVLFMYFAQKLEEPVEYQASHYDNEVDMQP